MNTKQNRDMFMNQPSFTVSMGLLVYLSSVFAHLHQHRRANDNKRIYLPNIPSFIGPFLLRLGHFDLCTFKNPSDIEKKNYSYQGVRKGGINCKTKIDKYTLLYIK